VIVGDREDLLVQHGIGRDLARQVTTVVTVDKHEGVNLAPHKTIA